MAGEGSDLEATLIALQVSVAKIEVRSEQIPQLVAKVELLQQTTVPMREHEMLLADVSDLKRQNTGAQSTWDTMVPRVTTMWEERSERIGREKTHSRWLVILSAAVSVTALLTFAREMGFHFP